MHVHNLINATTYDVLMQTVEQGFHCKYQGQVPCSLADDNLQSIILNSLIYEP